MKKLILLIVLPLITACDNRVESTNETNVEENSSSSKLLPTNQKQVDILKQLGLEMNGEKITIDVNKTADFMKKMEIEMHGRADEIERKIDATDINFSKGFGINLEEGKLELDLNKTKDMLQQLNNLMKDVLLDANRTGY